MDCLCAGILFADIACEPVDHLPEEGELVPTRRMQLGLGGCAANVAVDLAKLGVDVGVAGCVGDDVFGSFVIDSLDAHGIAVDAIRRLPQVGTSSTMIINVQGQDRRFISTPGASAAFSVEHMDRSRVLGAKVFYIGGYLMMPSLETEDLVELLQAARAAGVITVLDVVLIDRERLMDRLAAVLPHVDYFLPNDDEARLITGLSDPLYQAEKFRALGAGHVVITMGGEGTIMVGPDVRLRCGVYPVDFVGGAGSGDAFDAGFIAGLLAGEDPAGCLRWGSAMGASCVRAIGTTDSVFTRSEAEAFMKNNPLLVERM
ncbi:carbohydrate kinase family protein [Thermostilla marina]